jgi:hypothetical protein
LRLKTVNTADRELARAKADLTALLQEREQSKTSNSDKREELRRGIAQRDTSISELTTQLAREAETHQRKLLQIREACRIVKERCMVPQLQEEDKRYAAEVSRLNAELARERLERMQLQSQIDKLVINDKIEIAELDRRIAAAMTVENEARQSFRSAAAGNQIYRLAASWYRVGTSEVTQEQFATARLVFATFSAIAVALAGSMAALVYYARNRMPTDRSIFVTSMAKVARAIRAYYGRKRKIIVREVPGPENMVYRDGKEPAVVIEKEVIRFIDRIVLIPRFGIRLPVYLNSLFPRAERTIHPNSDDPTTVGSNVMPLAKR